jgi:hypothetical protein
MRASIILDIIAPQAMMIGIAFYCPSSNNVAAFARVGYQALLSFLFSDMFEMFI